jgi:serine/threonine-protein kinase
MGAVYLVEHVHTGEQLALKLLLGHAGAQSEAVERFKREARAPARIRSEHVVRVTDADVAPELGGAPFMVMEALNGADVEKLLSERGPLPADEVVWILSQIAGALDKAHALGIVHRDLKPENLFLHTKEDGSAIVKILDFGISKMHESGIESAALTQTGAMMGTPLYMAPEQVRGRSEEMGPPTDMWALGHIALHLLTAQTYWRATTIGELMIQIAIDPITPPSARFPNVGPRFDAWFLRSCDREPSQRWRSVSEQVAALAQSLDVAPAAVPGPMTLPLAVRTLNTPQMTTASPLSRSRAVSANLTIPGTRRSGALVLALAVVVLAGVATTGVYWRARRSPAAASAPPAASETVATPAEPTPPAPLEPIPPPTTPVATVAPPTPVRPPKPAASARPAPAPPPTSSARPSSGPFNPEAP